MNVYKLTGTVLVAAVMSVAGVASAQVVTSGSGVNVVSTPVTSQITPGGNGVTVGNFSVTGNTNGAGITSFPVSVTATNGATPGNLTNCQVYNTSGSALSTGNHIVTTLGATNVFVLDTPMVVSNTGGTVNLSLRCNVAAGTPSGSTFQIAVGAPYLNQALSVRLDTAPSVPAGSQNVSLANISIDATHSANNVVFSSFPITLSAGNGGSLGNLSGCQIFNSSAGSLSAASASVNSGGATIFTLSTPLTLLAGTADMLSLNCNVGAGTSVGSTYTLSIDPASIPVTVSGTGVSVTPTAGVGAGSNGLPAATGGTVAITSSTGLPPVVTTPGVPNTGAGTLSLAALFVLALAALVALGGALYLRYEIQ